MDLKDQLHDEMLAAYTKAGKDTGYWGRRFLGSVRRLGGLATAKRMLGKRLKNPSEQEGFRTLIEAGRADLSMESLVLQQRFRPLFTSDELAEAQRRMSSVPMYARRTVVPVDEVHSEDLADEQEFAEGAKKRITVNAYERDPKARAACLKRYGSSCQVCRVSFLIVYGEIGKQFIHVHHRKPLAGRRADYRVKPTIDLVPVCPNCHAMLHTSNPPLGIEELREKMANRALHRKAKRRR